MASTSIYQIDEPKVIQDFRDLLWEYGSSRKFDAALAGYQAELDGLPGKYGSPGGCGLIAYQQLQPAACIAYRRLDQDYCEMKRLYVSPKFRGLGLGRQLVAALLKKAKTANYQFMRLDTHPSMLAAQGLYKSFGFKEIERYNDNPIPGIRFFEMSLTEIKS